MSIVKIKSAVLSEYSTQTVSIEALKTRGVSQLLLTGLPDLHMKDSRDKIRALVAQLTPWSHLDRVIAHITPPEIEKNGAHLELPLAMACLIALSDKEIPPESQKTLNETIFFGALTLDGSLESTRTCEILSEDLKDSCIGPHQAATLSEIYFSVFDGTLSTLMRNNRGLSGQDTIPKNQNPILETKSEFPKIQGLLWEKFWILAAAVKRQATLLMGPPGVGKSTLAQWATQVLPRTENESIISEQRRLWRLAHYPLPSDQVPRLFPHPKSHLSELMGTKTKTKQNTPGYFSLAHGGALVLDEFLEMNKDCREILRTIIERKTILKQSSQGTSEWPADFWLITTTNPCPCGFLEGFTFDQCRCSYNALRQYQNRLSGPLWDRFGLRLYVRSHKKSDFDRWVPISIQKSIEISEEPAEWQNKISNARLSWDQKFDETSDHIQKRCNQMGLMNRDSKETLKLIHSLRSLFKLDLNLCFELWIKKRQFEMASMPHYFPAALPPQHGPIISNTPKTQGGF
jgi:magnesium chelatase family protein